MSVPTQQADFKAIESNLKTYLGAQFPENKESTEAAAVLIVEALKVFEQQKALKVPLKQTRAELGAFSRGLNGAIRKFDALAPRAKSILSNEYAEVVNAVGAESLVDNSQGNAIFSPDQAVRDSALAQLTEDELDELDEKSDKALSIGSLRAVLSALSEAAGRSLAELAKKPNKESDDAVHILYLHVAEILRDQLGVDLKLTRDCDELIKGTQGGALFSRLMRGVMKEVLQKFPDDSYPRMKRIVDHSSDPRGDSR